MQRMKSTTSTITTRTTPQVGIRGSGRRWIGAVGIAAGEAARRAGPVVGAAAHAAPPALAMAERAASAMAGLVHFVQRHLAGPRTRPVVGQQDAVEPDEFVLSLVRREQVWGGAAIRRALVMAVAGSWP